MNKLIIDTEPINTDNFDDIMNEYKNTESIFNTDCIRIKRLKHIIWNYLSENERKLFIYYLECDRKFIEFSKLLKCQPSLARYYINCVKTKIRNKYTELYE